MKNSSSVIAALCLLCVFTCPRLFAHEDTLITHKDGKLIGLPEAYQPAELDLKSGRLRIKNHVTHFSLFLQSLFDQKEPCDLTIVASWYHDVPTLPPYITFHIKPRGRDFSYQFMLDLGTLDIVKVTVLVKESEDATRYLDVELSDLQRREIKEAIKNVGDN